MEYKIGLDTSINNYNPDYFNDKLNLKTLIIYLRLTDSPAKLPNSISHLEELKELEIWGYGKNIENLERIEDLTSLVELKLYSISYIHPYLGYLTNLEYLAFNDLTLKDISEICHLPILKILDITKCESIYGKNLIIPPCIKKLQKLEQLIWTYNDTPNIPNEICNLKNLQGLYLDGNKILELPECLGVNQPKLMTISVVKNPIQKMSTNLIKNDKNFELRFDPFHNMPKEFIKFLPKEELEKLNKFTDTQKFIWFRKLLPVSWEEACKVGAILPLPVLKEYSSKMGINPENKNKRELCAELATLTLSSDNFKISDFEVDQNKLGEYINFVNKYTKLDNTLHKQTVKELLKMVKDRNLTPPDRLTIYKSDLIPLIIVHDMYKLDKDIKGWIVLQNSWLDNEWCDFMNYCRIMKGYSYKGDVWINRFLREQLLDLNVLYKDSRGHLFQGIFDDFKVLSGSDVIPIMDALEEIAKMINNIILSAPIFKDWLVVYRGEQKWNHSIKEKSIYQTKGIYSTSMRKSIAESFSKKGNAESTIYTIYIPPKQHCCNVPYNCTNYSDEEEILLPYNSNFYIYQIKKTDVVHITMILVDTPLKEKTLCRI